jgi:hypothetical protein
MQNLEKVDFSSIFALAFGKIFCLGLLMRQAHSSNPNKTHPLN